jgi:hypothetical protein
MRVLFNHPCAAVGMERTHIDRGTKAGAARCSVEKDEDAAGIEGRAKAADL